MAPLLDERSRRRWAASEARMIGRQLVEHGEETDLCAQVLGVDRDRAQRLTRGSEKHIIELLFVLNGGGRNRLRYRKDHMKIRYRKKLSLTIVEPLGTGHRLAFGAMPIAAANWRSPLAALWAKLLMGSWQAVGRLT
jgi:hypothetical protein